MPIQTKRLFVYKNFQIVILLLSVAQFALSIENFVLKIGIESGKIFL